MDDSKKEDIENKKNKLIERLIKLQQNKKLPDNLVKLLLDLINLLLNILNEELLQYFENLINELENMASQMDDMKKKVNKQDDEKAITKKKR